MTDPFTGFLDPDSVEERILIDLQRAPDDITRDVVQLLTTSNVLVSKDPSKAIFMSGGHLARVSSEIINGHVYFTIRHLSKYGLKGRLAEMAHWVDGNRHTTPNGDIVNDVIERADELCVDMPVLEQIITYPIFAPDGSLHDEPGYSRDTRCWYSPAAGLKIPEVSVSPTDEEIDEAVRLIRDELFVDFPFVDKADLANAFTILLEPFARRMIPGATPIHSIDAPKEGTGKSLLADLALLPSIGLSPKSSTQSHNEEDWKKQLTTVMLDGSPYWYCDNLRSTLDSAHLASTITKDVYDERILGGNTSCVRPIRHTWVITGNNISYSGEMIRRVAPTYLNAHSETPQLGRKFKHENIKEWARVHRGKLIWAALTIIRRWIAKGMPRDRVSKVLGMFEAWSEIMGNILKLAGVEGFLENLHTFYDEAIQEEHDSAPFVRAWYNEFGDKPVVASQLLELAGKHLELEKAIMGMAVKPSSKKVAGFLRKIKKRVYDGLEVVYIKRNGKADQYRVVPVVATATAEVSHELGQVLEVTSGTNPS